MRIDFKQLAVQFVRENNCAATTPAELIEKAMKSAAAEMARVTTIRLSQVRDELAEQRRQNVGTNQEYKPITLIPPHA